MKFYLSILLAFVFISTTARDTLPPPITERETSFENYELLVIALLGLAILLAAYFLWRRRRK